MPAVQAQTKDLLLLYQSVSHFLKSISRSFVDYPKKTKMAINTFGFLAPEYVETQAKSAASMLITITPREETSGIAFYRASAGNSNCQVLANMTSLVCLISGLPAGSQFEVEVVACGSTGVCSPPFRGKGYTLPDGKFASSRSPHKKTPALI